MLHIDSKDGELISIKVEGDILSILKDVAVSVLLLGESITMNNQESEGGKLLKDFSRAVVLSIIETLMNSKMNFSIKYALVSEAIEAFGKGELFNLIEGAKRGVDLDETFDGSEKPKESARPRMSLEDIQEIIKNMPRE